MTERADSSSRVDLLSPSWYSSSRLDEVSCLALALARSHRTLRLLLALWSLGCCEVEDTARN